MVSPVARYRSAKRRGDGRCPFQAAHRNHELAAFLQVIACQGPFNLNSAVDLIPGRKTCAGTACLTFLWQHPPGELQVVIAGLDPLLSGLFLWTRRMTLILLPSRRFATVWTRSTTELLSATRREQSALVRCERLIANRRGEPRMQLNPYRFFDGRCEEAPEPG